MKHEIRLLLTLVTALGLPVAGHSTSTLTQAQITKIVKDVKTVDPSRGARAAVIKETLQGQQSVRTGMESRTELLFNDNTITRLGANTHFSFAEGTRNMQLDSGVMLLQVPKHIGGAKIETAAVTAAVTGTTIMLEAGKFYTKLIVLEGECCLTPKADKLKNSKLFKLHQKVCALAGQEIILRNGAKDIPDAVYVNLKTLENTSLLLKGRWGTDLNHGPIDTAANAQGPDDYIPTNLAIIGAGTDVVIITGETPQTPGAPPVNPPPGGGVAGGPPGKFGALTTITSSNPYTINGGSSINTDPTLTQNGVTDYGKIYRGPGVDGASGDYFFGAGSGVKTNAFDKSFNDLQGNFPGSGVAVFRFLNLQINDQPSFVFGANSTNDLALVSEGYINVDAPSPTTLNFSPLNDLMLAAHGGITLGKNITLRGLTGFLKLYNFGAGNNININSKIDLEPSLGKFALSTFQAPLTAADFFIDTEGQLIIGSQASFTFRNGSWNADGGILSQGTIRAGDTLNLTSPSDVNLDGSITAPTFNITGNNVSIESTANITTTTLKITGSGHVVVDGQIVGSGDGPATSFTVDTSNSTGSLTNGADFFGTGFGSTPATQSTGFVDSQTININSRGYLQLDEQATEGGPQDYINNVGMSNNDIQNLTLAGSNIAVTNGFDTSNTGNSVTLNLAAADQISANGAINVRTFAASAGGGYFDQFNNLQNGVFSATGGDFAHYSEGTGVVTANDIFLKTAVDGNLSDDGGGVATFDTLQLMLNDNSTSSTNTTSLTVYARNLSVTSAFAEPTLNLSLYSNYDGDGGGGDIIIADAVNVSSFTAIAARSLYRQQVVGFSSLAVISTGPSPSITAASVNIQVGVDATLSQDISSGIATLSTVTSDGEVTTNRSLDFQLIDTVNGGFNSTTSFSLTSIGNLTLSTNFGDSNSSSSPEGLKLISLNLTAYNSNVALNGNVDVNSFTAYASNEIYGSGSVVANSTTLQVGIDATLTNTVTSQGTGSPTTTTTFGYGDSNSIELVLNDSKNPTKSLTLSAKDLSVSAGFSEPGLALSLNAFRTLVSSKPLVYSGGNITFDGNLAVGTLTASAGNSISQSGGGSITAGNVFLHQMFTPASVSQTGNTVSYQTVKINTGSLVNLTLWAPTLSITTDLSAPKLSLTLLGAVTSSGNITVSNLTVDDVMVAGAVDAKNSILPTPYTPTNIGISLTAASVIAGNGISFSGNDNNFGGGNGFAFTLKTTGPGALTFDVGGINGANFNGGNTTASYGGAGGNGGSFTNNSGGDININVGITANGGDANSGGNSAGGNGGTISLTAAGDINLSTNGSISAATGANSSGVSYGGNGGTVSLTAQGTIDLNSTIRVSSSTSASGGKINLTSHKPTGVAIHVANSGQLSALINASSPGAGGTITFVADSGGSINVEGTVQATGSGGTVNIQNTAASGQVILNGATLAGDVVKVGALGDNGTLTIGGGSISGDTAIKLYAGGSNGTVNFVSNTSLTGASLKSIAGSTVNVQTGVNVAVSGGAATVYTSHPNYTGSGGNGTLSGKFTGNGASTQAFANRPAF